MESLGAKEFGNVFEETLDFANKSINRDPINQSYIPLDEEVHVNIEILYGEIEIQTIRENMEFKFNSGSMIGSGIVSKVKEIYVDLDAVESLGDSISIKKIVQEAERKENAIVDENVYNLLKKTRHSKEFDEY